MQKNADTPQNFSMEQAMRIAQTPAGQQLLALLQQNGGTDLQQAMTMAASGDYGQAKKALSAVLTSPDAQKLLEQLGGSYGGNGR